ncbi:hypothetical protein ON010_g12430 [Phytophthora cinnamomi]|nr:hypothetical protein ON010_g12430 [Phytophthora cinnamomi]
MFFLLREDHALSVTALTCLDWHHSPRQGESPARWVFRVHEAGFWSSLRARQRHRRVGYTGQVLDREVEEHGARRVLLGEADPIWGIMDLTSEIRSLLLTSGGQVITTVRHDVGERRALEGDGGGGHDAPHVLVHQHASVSGMQHGERAAFPFFCCSSKRMTTIEDMAVELFSFRGCMYLYVELGLGDRDGLLERVGLADGQGLLLRDAAGLDGEHVDVLLGAEVLEGLGALDPRVPDHGVGLGLDGLAVRGDHASLVDRHLAVSGGDHEGRRRVVVDTVRLGGDGELRLRLRLVHLGHLVEELEPREARHLRVAVAHVVHVDVVVQQRVEVDRVLVGVLHAQSRLQLVSVQLHLVLQLELNGPHLAGRVAGRHGELGHAGAALVSGVRVARHRPVGDAGEAMAGQSRRAAKVREDDRDTAHDRVHAVQVRVLRQEDDIASGVLGRAERLHVSSEQEHLGVRARRAAMVAAKDLKASMEVGVRARGGELLSEQGGLPSREPNRATAPPCVH